MRRNKIKTRLDQEIKKECEKKSIDFSDLSLDEDLNLLSTGIFDSLGILQLISKLEDDLEADLDLSECTPSEFTNYSKLIDLLYENSQEILDQGA